MSCHCATEAAVCMPKPGVADLCCPTTGGCCQPQVTLATIPADTIAQFDLDGTVPDGSHAGFLPLLQKYAAAICASQELLASRVCMSRYAASCCVTFDVCVPGDCCCSCSCGACDLCDRFGVKIRELCVPVDRVASVTVNGEPAALNGDNPDAAFNLGYQSGNWKLYGLDADCGGSATVVVQLAEPTALWAEAVKALACSRVPCPHTKSCNKEQEAVIDLRYHDAGLLGVDFADDLVRECCNRSGARFAERRYVQNVRWGDCG